MNWVAPIKDPETLEAFRSALKKADLKYFIMFDVGVATGLQLQTILKYKVKELRGKKELTVYIGVQKEKRVVPLSKELRDAIQEYTKDMDPEDYVFRGLKANAPLTREQAYRAMKAVSMSIGISSVGAQTMRKTFAWKYYQETGDILYLQKLFNHATPTITLRFIGEKPALDTPMTKQTASENARCRKEICKTGSARIKALQKDLADIQEQIKNPAVEDAYYGSVECLLTEVERLFRGFHDATIEEE